MTDRPVARTVLDAPRAPSHSAIGRLRWVDTTRGACILLVVLLHTQDMLVQAGVTPPAFLDSVTFALGSVRMPGFFVVSGLLARSLMQVRWPELARRRVGLFSYLYVLWTAITAGVGALLATVSGAVPDAVGHIVLAGLTFDGVLWYLAALAVFFQVAWWCRRVPAAVQLAGAALLSVVVGLGVVPLDSWGVQHTVLLYVYFLAGLLLPTLVRELAARASVLRTVVYAAGWAAAAYGLGALDPSGRWLVTVLPLLGVPLLISLCAALTDHGASAALEWVGRNTLQLYVLHPLVLSALLIPARWLAQIDPATHDQLVLLLIVAAIVTALAYGAWLPSRRWRWLYALPARLGTVGR